MCPRQTVSSAITDEVAALREPVSDNESESGEAKLVAMNESDDNDNEDDDTSVSQTETDACNDNASSGDDDVVPGPHATTVESAAISSTRDEEAASTITSVADGNKCNSTATLIAYASAVVSMEERSDDCDLREGIEGNNSALIPPPSTVEATSGMDLEEKLTNDVDETTTATATTEAAAASEAEEVEESEQDIELQTKPSIDAATYMKGKVLEDNGELNKRLKKRWEKRNQERRAATTKQDLQTPTSSPNSYSSLRNQQSSKSVSTTGSNNSDTSLKGRIDSKQSEIYPDIVSFGVDDDEGVVAADSPRSKITPRSTYRKCFSDCGPNAYSSPPRRIGILQADGIVYDDALLLQLARQSHPSQHRERGSAASKGDNVDPMTGEEFPVFQTNEVKIHVYDLVTEDCLVEMPVFNCNFPLGRCLKAANDGFNYLGTGAYHVGVEVNGVEYAYGGNNIPGMSGVFTCIPKQSPGYDFRDTIDFGKLHTTKRTWIRIPKARVLNQSVSSALARLSEDTNDEKNDTSKKSSQHAYTFREIETFADGHQVVHEMARDYMGADYDLLRKNCCTFAHDACLRLGVKEEDIPTWFRNAAVVGAQAEDTLINVDNTVKNVFKCNEKYPIEREECGTGFEVIAKIGGVDGDSTLTSLRVVESSPQHRFRNICVGIPFEQIDQEIAMRETASWA